MSKEDSRKLVDATQEFLKQKYVTDMGQKVLVERHKIDGSAVDQLRDVLRDIGKDLQEQGVTTKEIKYLGSFSVHVYYSEIMKRMEFASLTAPDLVHFNVAEDAIRELWGSVCETYGRKRQKRRSGAS